MKIAYLDKEWELNGGITVPEAITSVAQRVCTDEEIHFCSIL